MNALTCLFAGHQEAVVRHANFGFHCREFRPRRAGTISAQQATPTVSVITAEKRPITESVRFVGRIQAIDRVDVRARVIGFLEEVLFQDGQQVKTGDALYRIEKGPFEASVQQAKANVLRAQAQTPTMPRSSVSGPKIC